MKQVFADTYFWLALVNQDDQAHARALQIANTLDAEIVTTTWVLVEAGDALSRVRLRPAFSALLAFVNSSRKCHVIEAQEDTFQEGVRLFVDRPDKEWSLTDCMSFSVMQRRAMQNALTADHHFEQAGFVALLK